MNIDKEMKNVKVHTGQLELTFSKMSCHLSKKNMNKIWIAKQFARIDF